MQSVRAAIRVTPAMQDEDRAAHRSDGVSDLVILADGAGGISGGRHAAELLVGAAQVIATPAEAVQELCRLDSVLSDDSSAGEATAVLLAIRAGALFGASVGDSGAWLIGQDLVDLTASQRRKPLLGSGAAVPMPFGPVAFVGRLLVASDGLLKYAPRGRIRELAALGELGQAADDLVHAARLPSGGLQDDVALVLLEPGF